MQIPATLLPAFAQSFGGRPSLFRAPGRVNLIGEHTDYTGGLVLPIAIDLATYTASAPNTDSLLRVYSQTIEQGREWPIAQLGNLTPARDWTDYVIGVVRQIPQSGGRDIL